MDVGEQLPTYFELQASVMIQKPTGGWKGNAYVIFDYQNEQDFKFAGIDESINKLVVGHRDASGWHVDKQGVVTGGVKADKYYNMLVAVNGTTVTLLVDNKTVFTHTFQPRVIDGYVYGLNYGYVGVGSDNSRGSYDNIRVQVLPPQVTFDNTETFNDRQADLFTAGTTGVWRATDQRYSVTPEAGAVYSLLDLGPDHLNHQSYLEVSTKVNTQGRAGVVFDRYGDESFKWAAIDASSNKLILGHYTKKGGWVEDASMGVTDIVAGQDYTLGLTLKGTTVSATLSGANGGNAIAMVGYVFNASTVDGNFGLMAVNGAASFDDVRVKTDDRAFAGGVSSNMEAATTALVDSPEGGVLTLSELDALATVAISEWTQALGAGDPRLAGMVDVRMRIGNLAGGALGHFENGDLTIDADAAGHGWFVDVTPADSAEFTVRYDRSTLRATEESEAFGRMDLLTVLMHELGHAIGVQDNAAGYAVMHEDLEPGVRFLLDELGFDGDPDQPVSDQSLAALAARAAQRAPQGPSFDFDLAAGQGATRAGVDWGSSGGWNTSYTPYVAPEPKASSNFADYLLKMFKRDEAAADYDSLGKSLTGKNGAKGGAKKA